MVIGDIIFINKIPLGGARAIILILCSLIITNRDSSPPIIIPNFLSDMSPQPMSLRLRKHPNRQYLISAPDSCTRRKTPFSMLLVSGTISPYSRPKIRFRGKIIMNSKISPSRRLQEGTPPNPNLPPHSPSQSPNP